MSAPHELGVRTAALLIFLARSARAGIVAADFGGASDDLLHGLTIAGTGHACLFEFAALAALERFFEIVHRSGD